MDSFSVHQYSYEGKLLGFRQFRAAELSPKWSQICNDMVDALGPVFETDMGSTLSHFKIECTAGFFHLSVSGIPAYTAVALPAGPEVQNQELLTAFTTLLRKAQPVADHCLNVSEFMGEITGISARPAFIVMDWQRPEIPEPERGAMFQLAYHFAAAYLVWRATHEAAEPGPKLQ